ncbi:AAA family ATPase [Jannaschia ovalis]|uniref:AAA family ATPase n=1 Tax=Jannaschia ovalis TaxID=3038773 RepID=A0ABY8L7X4_9RHOB|nr:AAA family ATPase [Jannaschia sp. GRR-S6-38]WGH77176.1 AAA family ATPase [Jannaschia sp. GRR-S6-38]
MATCICAISSEIGDRPVLFDALEFDEDLGTCDILYDAAFLIMDLCHRDLRRQACRVLDAWLREARGVEDSGLAALPLFISVRAAIRAMVALQTDAARARPGASAAEIRAFLDLALAALHPAPPMLIATGGYSGTGKSVLARRLAPGTGALPGAVLLSSDLERKAGRPKDRRLAPARYAPEEREAVYAGMFRRAETLLAAGQAVILDATFLDPALRAAASACAARAGVPFHGLWLDAPVPVLEARVRARRGDSSDADLEVLRGQLGASIGHLDWHLLEASGTPDAVLRTARTALGDGSGETPDLSGRSPAQA